MDNQNKRKGSFFKRSSDADSAAGASGASGASSVAPSSFDRSDYEEPTSGDSRSASPTRAARSARPAKPYSSTKSNSSTKPRFSSDDRPSRDDRSSRFSRDERPERASRGDRGDRDDRGDRAPRTAGRDMRKKVVVEEREAPENVIYGVHPVREAIDAGTAIEKIYVRRVGDDRENGARDYADNAFGRQTPTNNAALDVIRSMASQHNIPVQEVPVEKLDRLTRRNPHQGVVAVIPSIEYADINEICDALSQRDVPALIIVVDGVTDVRNFGAIARSAECAGADAIVMGAKNSAPVNAEAMKSSAGALSVVPVCRVGSIRNALKTMQMAGMQLVAATEKSSNLVFEADFTKSTVIVMGGEERGISGDVLAMCDQRIAIPLLGKIESLNVSAAAAVLLFEVVRQRFNAIE